MMEGGGGMELGAGGRGDAERCAAAASAMQRRHCHQQKRRLLCSSGRDGGRARIPRGGRLIACRLAGVDSLRLGTCAVAARGTWLRGHRDMRTIGDMGTCALLDACRKLSLFS